MSLMRRSFDIELDIKTVFETPTLADVAREIRQTRDAQSLKDELANMNASEKLRVEI